MPGSDDKSATSLISKKEAESIARNSPNELAASHYRLTMMIHLEMERLVELMSKMTGLLVEKKKKGLL